MRVIKGISLRFRKGDAVAILGANGASKSTMLRAILALLKPSSGRILLDGQDVSNLSAERLVAEGLSHVAEGRRIFRNLTVEQNLELGLYAINPSADVVIERRGHAGPQFLPTPGYIRAGLPGWAGPRCKPGQVQAVARPFRFSDARTAPFYDFLHLVKAAAEKAGSTDSDAIKAELDGFDGEGFFGPIRFTPEVHQGYGPSALAMAVVNSTNEPISQESKGLYRRRGPGA